MGKLKSADVLARLAQVLDCKKDEELAEALNVGKTTIPTWRHRGTIPLDECVDIAKRKGVTLDYLLLGLFPKERAPEYVASETDAAYGSIEQQREQQLRRLAEIEAQIIENARKQNQSLTKPQIKALVDFGYLYSLNDRGIARLLALLDYCDSEDLT